ncbi:hypothetical protein NOR53_366 [gamma proteobacterium NOR5-3]|nr:hypothetical protein NOR53_366 [gamma proteobacterium NOR5-3]
MAPSSQECQLIFLGFVNDEQKEKLLCKQITEINKQLKTL